MPHVNFLDGSDTHPILKLSDFLNDTDFPSSRPAKELHHFLLHLVLNHTVVPEERKDAAGNARKTLSASSPDEEAFVYTGALDRGGQVVLCAPWFHGGLAAWP